MTGVFFRHYLTKASMQIIFPSSFTALGHVKQFKKLYKSTQKHQEMLITDAE